MSIIRPLTDIKREGVECLATLMSDSPGNSKEAAQKLISEARSYGLDLRDYLTIKVDPALTASETDRQNFCAAQLDGYEASLAFLGLPVKNDYRHGVLLEAAADTFQTFPGTRALFPQVIDDMVTWKYRQDLLERVDPLVMQSRTVGGVEMISTVVDDKKEDYEAMTEIAEGSRIPVKSIRTTEKSVKFYKHGMGYRFTYEFQRRARLDLITPYANRAVRGAEISKVKWATLVLINGDTVHGAAPVVTQSSFNTPAGVTATNGQISYKNLMCWLVARAQAGTPIDTVVGNWDAYVQWLLMFSVPTNVGVSTDAQALAKSGFQIGGVPLLNGHVNFVLSSTAPANKLIGYSRGDTLEELVEAGSQISESERSIENQTVSYYRTENSGYRLVFGDTRSIYNYGA